MPRPKSPYKMGKAHFRLRQDTLTKFNLLCLNPLTGQPQHGLRGQILEALLTRFFDTLQNHTIPVRSIPVGDLQSLIRARFAAPAEKTHD